MLVVVPPGAPGLVVIPAGNPVLVVVPLDVLLLEAVEIILSAYLVPSTVFSSTTV